MSVTGADDFIARLESHITGTQHSACGINAADQRVVADDFIRRRR